jgi:hypothetical protein
MRGSPNVRRLAPQVLVLPAPIATLIDDFSGSTLNARWAAFGAGITVSGGTLNLLATTSYPSVLAGAPYRLQGSSIYLRVTPLPTGGGSFQTGLSLQVAPGGSNAQGAIGVNINGSPQIVQPFYRDNTGTEHDFGSITLPANPCWLRIRESGGTTFWDWSASGSSWTNFASMANPTEVTSLYVQIWAGHYAAETDTTAVFDNVNIVPQIVLPSADIVTTGWVTAPLFSKVNDSSDATVITATPV